MSKLLQGAAQQPPVKRVPAAYPAVDTNPQASKTLQRPVANDNLIGGYMNLGRLTLEESELYESSVQRDMTDPLTGATIKPKDVIGPDYDV